MASLKDMIAYLLANSTQELVNSRLTKLVYLADWRNAIVHGKQMSDVSWYFDQHGPFVWDIKHEIENRPDLFGVEYATNYFGSPKTKFSLKKKGYRPNLSESEIQVLDKVISVTNDMSWKEFIDFVYSTFPIVHSEKYSSLDLEELAKLYKQS